MVRMRSPSKGNENKRSDSTVRPMCTPLVKLRLRQRELCGYCYLQPQSESAKILTVIGVSTGRSFSWDIYSS